MTLPPIRKRPLAIKVDAARAFINNVPKTAEFKPAVQMLKKMLVIYEKYEGDAEMVEARRAVANAILAGVGLLTLRIDRNKTRI